MGVLRPPEIRERRGEVLRARAHVVGRQRRDLVAVVRRESQGRDGIAEDDSERRIDDVVGQFATAERAAGRATGFDAEVGRGSRLAKVRDHDVWNQNCLHDIGGRLRSTGRRRHERLNVTRQLGRIVQRRIRVVDLVAVVGHGRKDFVHGWPGQSVNLCIHVRP